MKNHNIKTKKAFICSVMAATMVFSGMSLAVFAVSENQNSMSVKQAAENLKNAQNEYDKANEEYQAVLLEKEQTETEIQTLKNEITDLESKSTDIKSEFDNSKTKLDNALKEVAEKEETLAKLKTKLEELTAKYDEGSFGFFEYVGATSALDALNNSTYASYTHKGSKTDATNLDNMKATFNFIRECNSLREKDKTDPISGGALSTLKVTDYMMATAQADANYSLTNIDHARQFNVGENLAWGYSDPFFGWYDEEKQEYLAGNNNFGDIGHYLNILDSDYYVTGFAIAKGGRYGIEHAQTFLYYTGENGMTVDEYESRFLEYYNRITEPMSETENLIGTTENELIKAKTDESACQENYNNLIAESESLKNDLSVKNEKLSDVEIKFNALTETVSLKKSTVDEKGLLYKSAQSDYDKAIADNKGDVNNDSNVNIADALMIARYDASLVTFDETQQKTADVNNDDEVNIADALMIARYDAGLIDTF